MFHLPLLFTHDEPPFKQQKRIVGKVKIDVKDRARKYIFLEFEIILRHFLYFSFNPFNKYVLHTCFRHLGIRDK